MLPALTRLALLFAVSATALMTSPLHAQDWAKANLEKSPRHREWVPIKHGDRTVNSYVVYPEIKSKAPVVILIHEIFGLSDWARDMADEIAAAGYIVVAPDLLSGSGPNGGGTDTFASMEATTKAVSGLNPDTVTADLDAVADYAKTIPAANGKLAVTGYCWGGGKSFLFATHRHDLSAAFVFYGPPPPETEMKNITAPIYGFYAGNDARIGATLPGAVEAMKTAGKKFEPITYDGAGHGFMRAGEDPNDKNPANKKARDESFARLTSLLKQMNTPTKGKSSASLAPNSSHLAKAQKKVAEPVLCHDPSMVMTASM
ncbi:dienelactone hydrolase family protein [soil metagenome]